jgi:hypothetical protein
LSDLSFTSVGWVLLALSVALVNAGSGLTALYILLVCVAWTLFLLFPVKIALRWLARQTGSSTHIPIPLLAFPVPDSFLSRKWSYNAFHDHNHALTVRLGFLYRHYRCSRHFRWVDPTICASYLTRNWNLGAFVAGLIVPREGNLAIALTEKLEDFVAIIFLPLVNSTCIILLFFLMEILF